MQSEEREPDQPDGTKIWLLLIKSFHALAVYAAPTLRASGLADSEFRVLEVLLHKGPLPVNTIGRRVYLTPGSISVAVERLCRRGLVARAEDPHDRRVRTVSLTVKGRRLIQRVFAAHAADMNALARSLPLRERKQLARSLKRLGRAAEAVAGRGDARPAGISRE